jgi:hypothetical protein
MSLKVAFKCKACGFDGWACVMAYPGRATDARKSAKADLIKEHRRHCNGHVANKQGH